MEESHMEDAAGSVSFARDILPLFRPVDIDHMRREYHEAKER